MKTAQIIAAAKKASRTVLGEIESKQMLSEAGIPVVETFLAATKQEAIALAQKLGFPVVLKIVSPEISHKSDAGGVKVNLGSAEVVATAYDDIMQSVKQHCPEATIEGVSVQKMARAGSEAIIGMTKDPQFGPVLMFGLGGVLVELLGDVSFRIVPLTGEDAQKMISETKCFPLLRGFRGREVADISALEDILLKLSSFVEQHPEIKELDLNPVLVYPQGALAVDARVVLEFGS